MTDAATERRDVAACPAALLRRGDVPISDRAVRSGELTAVMRGIYVARDDWAALSPWDRYLARVHAAAHAYPGATFSGESAAVLLGLPIFREPREVHIVAPPSDVTSRAVAGVRFHTTDRIPDSMALGGFVVVTPAEAAVDIARSRHNAIGLATAGAVLRAEPRLTRANLEAINEKRMTKRGRRHARWVIERATPVPESPLENVSLAVIEWLGFPPPDLQHWVRGAAGEDDDRVDFWWPDWSVAGEADGRVKYSGDLGDARDALQRRNIRDARLLRRGVRATAHWEWADAAISAQLKARLLAAGLPLIALENTPQLRTLPTILGFGSPIHP